jgi:AAA family ATP:ADP antiporter
MWRRARSFLDIRPGEGGPVLMVVLYIAVVTASFVLAKPIRNGLFLREYGAYRLAYVYVGVPVVLSVLVPLYQAATVRLSLRTAITASLVFLSSNVLLFWFGFATTGARWISAAFYIWVNCYAVVAPVQAWTFANLVFDTRQARRLFGVVGAGASSGAIVGGLLALVLVSPLGTVNLLLVLAGLILAAAVIVNVAWYPPRRPVAALRQRTHVPFAQTLARIAGTPYLRDIAILVVLVAIATQWTQFQFGAAVQARFGDDADRLTRFFGQFTVVMGVTALIVQLLLTGTLLKKFGIALTILLLPVSLAVGSLFIVAAPGLLAVLVANSFDQTFRFSVDKATFELLYLPISSSIKSHVKGAIDVVISRAADAVGGVLLGLATGGFNLVLAQLPGARLGLRGVAALNLLLIACWIGLALRLRRGYVFAVRESIERHRFEIETAATTVLDRDTRALIAVRLEGSNEREIVYALDLLGPDPSLAPRQTLRALLRHHSPAVRHRALQRLNDLGDGDIAADVTPLLDDADLATRTEALVYLARHTGVDPLDRLGDVREQPDFTVQAGIVAFLTRPGQGDHTDAVRVLLERMVDDLAPDAAPARAQAARLLAFLPPGFTEFAPALLGDPDIDVRRQTLASLSRPGAAACAPAVVRALADPALSDVAARALEAMGSEALDALSAALDSAEVPIEARRRIPDIVADVAGARARLVLTRHLLQPDPALRHGVIRVLSRSAGEAAGARVADEALETGLAAEILGHYRSYQILGRLGDTAGTHDIVGTRLRQSIEQERERIFGLMEMRWPDRDLRMVHLALRSSNPAVQANGVELLDNILPPEMRPILVPLLDPQVSVRERARLANRFVGTPIDTREHAVAALIESEDPWLRACGAFAAGELGLAALVPRLQQLTGVTDTLIADAARDAIERIERAAAEAGEEGVPVGADQWREPHGAVGVG